MLDFGYRKPALAALFLVAGCATVKAPELAQNHPANPDAIESAVPARSQTLKSYWTPAAAKSGEKNGTAADMTGMDHSQHMKDMEGMDHSQHMEMAAKEDHSGHGAGHELGESAAGRPGKADKVDREIKITALDTMRYEPASIQVKADETIRFVVTNTGKLAHEFVIGDAKEQLDHAEMMRRMPTMKHEHDNAITLEPGEMKNLIWQFGKSGELEIACHVPGHYEAGMHSKVEVAQALQSPAKDKAEKEDEHGEHKH